VIRAAHKYALDHKWNELTAVEAAALAAAGR
jgi:hypothetical protein